MSFTCLDVVYALNLGAPKKSGREHLFSCPNHEDKHPSLSINPSKDVWMCGPCGAKGTAWALAAFVAGYSPDDKENLMPWLRERNLVTESEDKGGFVCAYVYEDENRKPLHRVERYRVPPPKKKTFFQSRPDGNGGWIRGTKGVRLVPFLLPEFIKLLTVNVMEGEADCEELRKWNLPATTNAMGAGSWKSEYSQYFKDKQVCIFPDNDTEGEAHAEKVAKNLFPVAKAVKIVHLPGLLEKGDFRDWKAAGGTLEEFKKIVKSTPVLTEDDVKHLSSNSSRKAKDKEEASSCGFKLTPLGDLLNEEEEEIPWLVDKHLPSAGLSILGGKPKAGKSVLSRCLALNIARGTPFLDFETAQGSVFYLGLEEKRSEVKNHFSAMGATLDDPIFVFIAPSPQDGLAQLREAAERERPALIIVDPILKMVRVKDGNDYATMSAALEPVLTLARDTGAHVLGVHHLSKGDRYGGDSLLGSTAIFAAVDTALFYKRSERYRTLFSIQRYGEDLEEVVLVMDPDTKIISAGGERKEVDERQVGKAILEYLKDLLEPIDEKEIHESVEGRKSIKAKALRALVEQEKVVRTGGGKRGNPYLYFVSGSLVPTICREPEYQKRKTEPKCGKESTYSGSRQNPISGDFSKHREPETRALSERPKEAVIEDGWETIQ